MLLVKKIWSLAITLSIYCLGLEMFFSITSQTFMRWLWLTSYTVLIRVAEFAFLGLLIFILEVYTNALWLLIIGLAIWWLALCTFGSIFTAESTICYRLATFKTLGLVEPKWWFAYTKTFLRLGIKISLIFAVRAIVLAWTSKAI